MGSIRIERISNLIRMIVSDTIQNRMQDPRVSSLASVTRVDLTGDLKYATVYVSVIGDETAGRKTLAGLEHASGFVQSRLAERLTTRQCPALRFKLDRSIKQGFETIQIIERTIEETEPADAAEKEEDDTGERA